jgi:signal transduction histidine kinase/ligand-binding sensor domain-containing protein
MNLSRPAYALIFLCAWLRIVEGTAAGLNPQQKITQYSLTQWGHRDGLPSTSIYAIAQTPDGFLWLGTADGLVRFDGIRFLQVPLSTTGDMAFGRIQALTLGRTGALWIGTESGSLVRMQGSELKVAAFGTPIVAIRENSDASIHVETADKVFRVEPQSLGITACPAAGFSADAPGRKTSSSRPSSENISIACQHSSDSISPAMLALAELPPDQLRRATRDSDGNVWIATRESGIYRIHGNPGALSPSVERLSVLDGLSNDSVWDIFEDREHNLWIATQNGLNRLRDDKFSTVTRHTGLLSNNISSLAVVSNEIYAGSTLGLNRVAAGHSEAVLAGAILALTPAANGSLFASTPLGLSMVKQGRLQPVSLGVNATHISVMVQRSSDELWFYDHQEGLYRWRPGHAASRIILPALQNKIVSVMQADIHGRVWLGLTTGEVLLYDGTAFRTFTEADNLPGGVPHYVSVNNDGSAWIASERGLALFTGDSFVSWSRKNGLPGSRVLWAVPGPAGRLWLGYNIGVASIRIEDLRRAISDANFLVPYDLYDEGDGLRSSPDLRGGTPVAVLPGGRIWLTTSEGLATIDPAHIRKNLLPPPVHILQLTVDDVNRDFANPVTLPPRTRRIEVNYSGLGLTDPRKVAFRYRLLGFDSHWNQASTRRFATYTNLPPGKYRFEVIAANEDGIWNETPDTLEFTLSPAVYQTKWFLALCLVALLLVGILLFRLRVQSAADRLRLRFEERLDERARVAQDLHDNLLQEVMGISLQLEIADELTPPGAAGKPILKRALQLSKSALTRGRGALTTLRATSLTRQEVFQTLALAAAPFPEERRRAIQYATDGAELPLRAGVGEEIVQIAQEALRNALQHAHGTVHIGIHYASSRFSLVVDDEGQGISPTIMESGVPGHFGLKGMRERAARIASTLTIEPKARGGTRVQLSVPARMAYSGFDTASGLWTRFTARWTRTKPSVEGVSQDE